MQHPHTHLVTTKLCINYNQGHVVVFQESTGAPGRDHLDTNTKGAFQNSSPHTLALFALPFVLQLALNDP